MINQFRRTLDIVLRESFLARLKEPSRHIIRRLYKRLSILFVVPRFRNLIRDVSDVDKIVDLAFSFKQLGISVSPLQVREETVKILHLAKKIKPKILLEIGTARSGTLLAFTRIADPAATIISLDLPGGPFGGGYPKWNTQLYSSFARDKQKIHLLRADSHNPRTFKQVKTILGTSKIDFLFIDGDHTYEGIKKDFKMYMPLIRKGGMLALHDILPHDKLHDPSGEIGVPRFWNEIRNKYKHLEIVKSRKQGWAGIGLLYV